MGDSPWFPQYPNDWLGSAKVTVMNIAEEGAYHRLLNFEWNEPDCTLPADPARLKVLAKVAGSPMEAQIDFNLVLRCFQPVQKNPSRIFNPRLMEEWKKMKQLRKERSESGRRGNAIRWGSRSDRTAIANVSQPAIAKRRSSQSQSQSPEEKEEERNIVGLAPDAHSPVSLAKQAEEVLTFLNEKAGRKYRAREASGKPSSNLEHILARLKAGATIEQCRGVIAKKCREWRDDPKMAPYLRPATLFNRTKFEQYSGEVGG